MEAQQTRKYVHNGLGTVRPHIYGWVDLLDFAKSVLGAKELERNTVASWYHVQAQ